jgi:hypothetical protein
MSKNLTRKGLALGAVVALGSSLFAGTPATAAPTAITFASAYGTSTTGVLGEYFYLSALLTGGANADPIKFYVEGATAANIVAATRKTTDLAATAASGATYTQENEVDTDAAAKIATVPTTSGSQNGYKAGNYVQLAIKLGAGVTTTTSIKITPFVDSALDNDEPNAANGELVGTPITVNFVKASELTATPTVKAPSVGSAVEATVAVSGGVNLEQFRLQTKGAVADSDAFTLKFRSNGTLGSTSDYVRWNTTDKEFVAVSTDSTLGTNSAIAGRIYGATAFVKTVESASATVTTASAGEVASLQQIAITGNSYNSSFNSSSNVLRAGAGSFALDSKVLTVATGKLKSGQKVTFKIAEQGANTLTSGATITAGGKTLTNSSTTVAQSITVEATSDASGVVSVPVTYTGLAAADQITVQAYATPASTGSALIAAGNTVTLIGQTAIAAKLVDDITSKGGTDSVRYVVKGGTVSIPVRLVDQFGQVPAGSFRVGLAFANVSGSSAAPAFTTPVALSNGTATITLTDNSTAAQVYTVTATLAKLNADGVTWETGTTAGFVEAETVVSRISAGSAYTVGSISLSSNVTTSVSRAVKTLVAGNEDLESGTVAHNSPTLGATLTTSVAATDGAAAPGAAVTFSAPGVLFKSGNVWGLESLTVNAANDGTLPSVTVYSNVVGSVTITATSGSVSKTVALKFAGPTDGGTQWVITAPTYILPGQTLKVTGVLKDKYGAVVNTGADAIKVAYTGPGYLTATPATETDADGAVSFTVLLGAADTGSATIKFTYGGADSITADTSADDVVAQAIVTLGAAPAASATAAVAGSTKRFFVSVSGNTGAKNVVVKVAGKTFKTLKGSTAKKTYTVAAPKGSHKVTVYVGGKLVATKTISVK